MIDYGAVIELEGVSKTFRTRPTSRWITALDGIDLRVWPGELAAVVGPRAAGKTTLLRCVNRLERPDAGRVWIGDLELTGLRGYRLRAARRRIGTVLAGGGLLTRRTVRRNVGLPLECTGVGRRDRDLIVDELLDLAGLATVADRFPGELTPPERVRGAIARALTSNPVVLLCDDVDDAGVLGLLARVCRERGTTVLLAATDRVAAEARCDRVLALEAGRMPPVRTDPMGGPVMAEALGAGRRWAGR